MGVLHQSPSSIKGHRPSKVVFHKRLSSIKGCLPSKIVFHQWVSSIKGRLLFCCVKCALKCYRMFPYCSLLSEHLYHRWTSRQAEKTLIGAWACALPKHLDQILKKSLIEISSHLTNKPIKRSVKCLTWFLWAITLITYFPFITLSPDSRPLTF